ncbi:MAG: hypothetical protein GY864_10835 [Desulfobacterales bacterium]|nr:hypothetical protein [Desulfobacterales bacterium]
MAENIVDRASLRILALSICVSFLAANDGDIPHPRFCYLHGSIPGGNKLVQYRKATLARNAVVTRQNKISDEMKQEREQKQASSEVETLNQDAEILALLLEAGADPSPPGCDQYITALPADSEKADRIRELLDKAREKRK